MSGTRIALALVAVAGGGAVVLVAAGEGDESTPDAVLGVAIGWSFVASGLVAWARRPENSIGRVMVLAGFLRLGGEFCAGSDQAILYPVGHLLHLGFWIAVAYVLLVFPGGRVEGALSRWLLAGAGLLLVLRLAWLLLGGDGDSGNALALTESAEAADAVDGAETGLGLLLTALLIVFVALRWRGASPRLRVALAPVLWAGAAGFGLLPLALADEGLGNPFGDVPMLLLDLVVGGVAFGLLAGVLRARLARSTVADLVVDLGNTRAPGDLRDALARTLRDPSLTVGYWLPDSGRYVDVDGRPFELPAPGQASAVSFADLDGRRIAALVHDPALADEPQLVESVCAAAALALENERLQAELRARIDELRASRARIAEAADAERRRIERNLHDGTQQRLASISMALGLAEAKVQSDPVAAGTVVGEARRGVSAALEELRELSHGIHPGVLSERGLTAALDELRMRAAIPVEVAASGTDRLPAGIEAAAYYVVSEALANVTKHAHATSARIDTQLAGGNLVVEVADDGVGGADLSRGSGLRGLTDRVEALGGRLLLSSPPHQGTVVRAEFPCA